MSTYCLVASSRFVVGSAVTVTEDRPANEEAVPPKEIDVDPIVTDELVSDEFPMFDRVLLAPLIDTPLSVESVPPRFSVSEPIVTELLTRLLLPMLDSVFADPLMETPFSVDSVPPRLTVSVPIVIELLVRLEFAMLLKVLLEPLIVLLVSVSVVSRPTSVSVLVGSVRVPVLTIVAMTGAVSVLLVKVWVPDKVTTVLSMLIVFAFNWHQSVPQVIVLIASLVMIVQAFRYFHDQPQKVLYIGLAVGLVMLISIAVIGQTNEGGAIYISLAWPWHFPIGAAMTFVIGYLVGNKRATI